MCLFKTPKPQKMSTPPAIKPRVETDTALPITKDLVKPDETADVSYGSKKKESSLAAANKSGGAGLKIPLNVGNTASAKTGGLNV